MSLLTRGKIVKRMADSGPHSLHIDPLLDPDQIGPVTVDLRLGYDFLVSILTRKSFIDVSRSSENNRSISSYFQSTRREVGENFIVYPGQTVLTTTLEYISVPTDVYVDLMVRSSYSRLGLFTGAMIQPGFRGCFAIELFNHSNNPVELVVGSRIFQARFSETTEHSDYDAGDIPRKYMGTVRPVVSKAETDVEISRMLKKMSPL